MIILKDKTAGPAINDAVLAHRTERGGFFTLISPPQRVSYLDESGEEITDTYDDTLEKALDQANWEFNVQPDEWDVS